jgi:DNA-binding transcriptional regulator YiaG
MTKKITMTARQYQRVREQLGLSNYKLHQVLGISLRQAQRYESDEATVDETVARLLRMFEMHGIPKDWL